LKTSLFLPATTILNSFHSGAAMGKRLAIIQSCYIPWRGFFDFIGRVDEDIIFDDVQFGGVTGTMLGVNRTS
jgi:WbqC-like protein family